MSVRREEIVDLATYERRRPVLQQRVFFEKERRRIQLGAHLTFLFENEETLRYQIQEMLRIEKRSGEEEIEHELRTYNELLGDAGELGCTLLIAIEDPAERDRLLRDWLALPAHLYLRLPDATRVPATFDPRQVGDDRLSSVQYLKFRCGAEPPVALGCDLPALQLEVELTAEQRAALAQDLG